MAPSGCVADFPDDLAQKNEHTNEATQEIKGPTTIATDYPEAVSIWTYVEGVATGICSGTIIAPRVVLTAGHCVLGRSQWRVWAPHASNQTADSVKGIRYDWLDMSGSISPIQHDIGLVVLNSNINIPRYPVIADRGTTANVRNIGAMNNGVYSNTQMHVGQPVAIADGAPFGYPFDYYSSIDVIQPGDSGGPAVVAGSAPHTIVAVNSGLDVTSNSQVLARVDLLYPWIQDRLKPTSCGPTCPNPLNQSQFFIRQLYLDVLGREPESAGASFWLKRMQSCNGDVACLASIRVTIAHAFFVSPENLAQYPELDPASSSYNSSFVKHCYWSFLGRQPDTAGFNYWLNNLNTSGNYNGVIAGFVTSPEYRSRFGAP